MCDGVERGEWAVVAAVEASALVELHSFARAFRVPLIAFGAARETESGADGASATSSARDSTAGAASGSSFVKPADASLEDRTEGNRVEPFEGTDAERETAAGEANSFMLNVKPPTSPALAHLVRHYNWSNLTFVYDSVQGMYEYSSERNNARFKTFG